MSSEFQQLLDATIDHLRDLKEHGVRFVNIAPQNLAALAQAGPAPAEAPLPSTIAAPESASRPIASRSAVAAATDPTAPSSAAAATQPASSQDKVAAMNELRQRALVCMKCPHLASSRKNVVFGVGTVDAELMFVGEAPGADEDTQGEPFVGAAGQMLTRIIQTMGLSRERVYIGNILKCRPDTPGQASGNRKPTPEEMQTCLPYLQAQIDIIQPKALVALGATAVEGLIHKTGITKLRGNWQEYRGIPLMPTFHPSFLLRPENAAKKRQVWEDMLQVMERLGMPISEKQQGYFSKA